MDKIKMHLSANVLLCMLSILVACGGKQDGKKSDAPAKQSNPLKEGDLNRITLTAKAAERLGIQTAKLQQTSVGNSRTLSGELVPVPGKMVTINAPAPGTLLSGATVVAGANVSKGQLLYRLLTLPSERDMVSAQEEVRQREVQYNTALEKRKRASRMYEEKSGSQRALQEAEAELASVTAQLNVARGRISLLRGDASAATRRLSTLSLHAPISGTIMKVYSTPSQVLAAAAPIVDIVALDRLWVRVPLYAGDDAQLAKGAAALVQGLSANGRDASVSARPVSGPQTSDPLATSIDVYYEVDNTIGRFRPGQKVSVTLSFSGSAGGLVIPFSAVVYDIQGGTWVYTSPEPLVFVRERVELKAVQGKNAVLSRGPAAGTPIVIVGAAELFGTEFGGGK
ncbi:MAG: efflux RND transporter periplasmic adaptor subunit [Chitinophagaceae bacterium]|nr:MAG: efflux RND transporter periplasmic adaptor subunit [Chitinophagaceae bacterium]